MRVYTVDEANEELPRVAAIVEEVRRLAVEASLGSTGTNGQTTTSGNGHHPSEPTADRLAELLGQLEEDGIVLRDPQRGLLDFPAAAPSGRTYWLCWLRGEPDISWWHWTDEGFAGRRPLTDPPE